ncbi:MAG: hypothetical protein C5B48_04045 [Candidatus Rokuibacteriota bacterium]|nr:MAG: hypothetical protein C5B48_04045 [Candidatus Rokubacteria bacterium]
MAVPSTRARRRIFDSSRHLGTLNMPICRLPPVGIRVASRPHGHDVANSHAEESMNSTKSRRIRISSVVLLLLALGARPAEPARKPLPATVDQLLSLPAPPFAIGHRGFGDNLGEDPSRPIENSVPAVRRGFAAGVSVVEVDVQLTKDGKVAVFHDDFLSDFTCINRLTLAELQARQPRVPSLQAVLDQSRRFNQSSGPLRGLVIVELKAAAPLCDPDDIQDRAIVSAVTSVIVRLGMTRQVMLTSFSPALLYLAAIEAPEMTRILAISGLQFLTAAEIEERLGLPVTLIDKRLALGLQWADVGSIFRLPGYQSVADVVSTATIASVHVVEADIFFLSSAGAPFVETLHELGLKAFGFTADDPAEWVFLESLGLDGIYANDIPFAVAHQAPIP